MQIFSRELKHRMQELDLSHADVARLSGITERAFSHYVTGRSEPSLEALVRIAEILACTPNDLLGLTRPDAVTAADRLRKRISGLCLRMDEATLKLTADVVAAIASWRGK